MTLKKAEKMITSKSPMSMNKTRQGQSAKTAHVSNQGRDDYSTVDTMIASIEDTPFKSDLETQVKPKMHPNALKSLEPLFVYFKMVCESNMTFPGFRRGPGSSAIPRCPFMMGRLRAQKKREEADRARSLSSLQFVANSHTQSKVNEPADGQTVENVDRVHLTRSSITRQ
jgi:hypothetical protein